ncbi:MAG: FtsQ-type POTRA domain-containing protein [Nitrospiraceae bacterium]|nr:FtsQ-type POTRA domain-containing protein [Nitrospiraceae bacterium]
MSDTNKKNIRSLKRNMEHKRLKLVLVLSVLLIAIFVTGFVFVRSYLPVTHISFIGNSYIKNEELGALLKVKASDPLYAVSSSALAARLKKSAWVKDVSIRREPWGNMVIRIREALPLALLDMGTNPAEEVRPRPYLIDADGVLLEQLREGTELFLPVIRGIHPEQNKDAYIEAIKFIKLLHSRRISTQSAVEITGSRPEDLTMRANSINVKIGSGDFDRKLEKLFMVKDEIEKKGIRVDYIDLRFSDKIIVKPIAEEKPKAEVQKKTNGKKKR